MNLKNLEYIKKIGPGTKEEIENVEKHIIGVLPKIYKEFLRQANGLVLDLCVLYDTHRIVESYECNEFADYAPGYISIGNDNGDRELIIKAEKGAVQCGFLDAAELGEGESEEWLTLNCGWRTAVKWNRMMMRMRDTGMYISREYQMKY